MAYRDQCMTHRECQRFVFKFCYTLYKLGLYKKGDRIPSEVKIIKFTEKYRLYTEATSGL